METTTTSSCKNERCSQSDCNCDCDDCLEHKVADTCLCVCHMTDVEVI
jgi:hypothetical protein